MTVIEQLDDRQTDENTEFISTFKFRFKMLKKSYNVFLYPIFISSNFNQVKLHRS